MKSVSIDLPDRLADEVAKLVEAGWFRSEDELIRAAVSEFVRRHRLELSERFQLDDIAWAFKQRPAR